MKLNVHNAEIKTATVEIKTMTISGRQVTLSVFRQLQEERLMNRDGSLNGVPWGTINYHPGKCSDEALHIHVVWQRGTDLLRSTVWLPEEEASQFDEYFPNDDFAPEFYSDNGDAALTLSIYHAIKESRKPLETKEVFEKGLCKTVARRDVPGLSKLRFDSVQSVLSDSLAAQAAWLAGKDKTEILDSGYEHRFSESKLNLPKYVSCYPDYKETQQERAKRFVAANEDRVCGKVLERVMQKLAVLCEGYFGAEKAFKQELAAEVTTRQAYIDAVDALMCLPQLFIAV